MSALKDIIIVYPERETALAIRSLVQKNGFRISHVCRLGSSALELASLGDGQGIIVCPFFMSDMNAVELAEELPPGFDVVALNKSGAQQFTGNLISLPVPINTAEFLQTLSVLNSSKASITHGGRSDEECISAAKQLLMSANGFSEMQAHKYLQKESMKSGKRLSQLAAEILEEHGGVV